MTDLQHCAQLRQYLIAQFGRLQNHHVRTGRSDVGNEVGIAGVGHLEACEALGQGARWGDRRTDPA